MRGLQATLGLGLSHIGSENDPSQICLPGSNTGGFDPGGFSGGFDTDSVLAICISWRTAPGNTLTTSGNEATSTRADDDDPLLSVAIGGLTIGTTYEFTFTASTSEATATVRGSADELLTNADYFEETGVTNGQDVSITWLATSSTLFVGLFASSNAIGDTVGIDEFALREGTLSLPTSVTLNALTNDLWVYDSGAPRGLNAAQLPLSGTAVGDGTSIVARAVRADTSAPVTPYTLIGTVSSGSFSGTLPCPRSPHALRIEVQQDGGTTVLTPANRRYISGHVIDAWGQSWFNGIFNFGETTLYEDLTNGAGVNATDQYPIANPDQVQVIGVPSTASAPTTAPAERRFVRNDQAINTQLVRFANFLNATAPNDRFCIVAQARAGTGISDLMNDATSPTTTRDWNNDVVPVNTLARTDGATAGLVYFDWFHNLRSLNENATELLYICLFGQDPDGNAVATGTTYTADSGDTFPIDHYLPDLYDYDVTRVALSGPQRNEIDESSVPDAVNAFTDDSGAYVPLLAGADQVRDGYEAIGTDTSLTDTNGNRIVVSRGLQGNHIAARIQDSQHPIPSFGSQGFETEDGDATYEKFAAYALLAALGYTPDIVIGEQPEISSATWTSDYIEVSFTNINGPVNLTTTRALRGNPAITSPLAHQTEVMGFEIMGRPVTEANLVNGNVRIGPLGGAPTVTLNDGLLQFARGIGGGQLAKDEDLVNDAAPLNSSWLNFPGVAKAGLSNTSGAQIIPARVPAKLLTFTQANTLDVAPGTSTRSDATTKFESPGTLSALIYGRPPGTSNFVMFPQGTIEVVATIPTTALVNNLFLATIASGPGMRFRGDNRRVILAGAGTVLSTGNDAYTVGTEGTFRMSWSASAGTKWLHTPNQNVSNAYTDAGEPLSTLEVMDIQGVTGAVFRHFKFWDTATGDGTAPTTVPLMTISGGTDYTNVHPWKVGADFT